MHAYILVCLTSLKLPVCVGNMSVRLDYLAMIECLVVISQN